MKLLNVLTILTIGALFTFSSCELYELNDLTNTDSEEVNITRTLAPDPATVIKKVTLQPCVSGSATAEFDVYITPAAHAFYCEGTNSLNYSFKEGEDAAPVVFNSNAESTRFSLPGGTKYTLELYSQPGNVLVSTVFGFQLEDCTSNFMDSFELKMK